MSGSIFFFFTLSGIEGAYSGETGSVGGIVHGRCDLICVLGLKLFIKNVNVLTYNHT